jgi:hypothetical protein
MPTIDDLRLHPLFFQLTAKQREFLMEFVTNGYKVNAAVMKAYPRMASETNANSHGRKLLRNWKMRRLVTFMGDYKLEGMVATKEEVAQLLTERIRDKATPAQWFLEIYRELAYLSGWMKRPSPGNPKWTRKDSETLPAVSEIDKPAPGEKSIEDMVLEIEAKKKEKRNT